MIEYRKLVHEDYNDIVEMCKGIWDGTDYLPELFHKWVDDRGLFLGAYDTDAGKIVGVDKYSVLHDGTGWLEGLRTHKDYRGKGIGKELALKTLDWAKKELAAGHITKIAFSTHISSVESITLMKKLGFKLTQEYIFVMKDYQDIKPGQSLGDLSVEAYAPSYEDFAKLPYLRRRNDILPFVFYFQKLTKELYSELLEDKCFISVNGHKGLYKLKGEPHFIVFDESLPGIEAFMDYCLLLNRGKCPSPPITAVMQEDSELIAALKSAGYAAIDKWNSDYLYFTYSGE